MTPKPDMTNEQVLDALPEEYRGLWEAMENDTATPSDCQCYGLCQDLAVALETGPALVALHNENSRLKARVEELENKCDVCQMGGPL